MKTLAVFVMVALGALVGAWVAYALPTMDGGVGIAAVLVAFGLVLFALGTAIYEYVLTAAIVAVVTPVLVYLSLALLFG